MLNPDDTAVHRTAVQPTGSPTSTSTMHRRPRRSVLAGMTLLVLAVFGSVAAGAATGNDEPDGSDGPGRQLEPPAAQAADTTTTSVPGGDQLSPARAEAAGPGPSADEATASPAGVGPAPVATLDDDPSADDPPSVTTTTTVPPATTAPPTTAPEIDWARIAACMFPDYAPNLGLWQSVGGTGWPHEAPISEQIARTQAVHAAHGWTIFGNCAP